MAHNFRGDWQMLWKEIALGFLLAGFIAQLGNGFFEHLFIRNAPAPLPTIENVIIGPIIAVISFVCSVGNVPLAAVLWSGGISFGGVLAFLFADLIVIPIVLIYRKYYGTRFTVRITALMFITMVIAALIVDAIFGGLGLIPHRATPDARRHLQRDPGQLQAGTERTRIRDLRGAVLADRTARSHRPELWDEGGPRQGGHVASRRRHVLLLLHGLPTRVRDRPRKARIRRPPRLGSRPQLTMRLAWTLSPRRGQPGGTSQPAPAPINTASGSN